MTVLGLKVRVLPKLVVIRLNLRRRLAMGRNQKINLQIISHDSSDKNSDVPSDDDTDRSPAHGFVVFSNVTSIFRTST